MATRSRGNGTHFGWLKKSCDISTCDLSPDGNLEKYRRPMKSAIAVICSSGHSKGSISKFAMHQPLLVCEFKL